MSEIIDWNTEYPKVEWCGYVWQMDAESGRKIHPNKPREYYHPSCVEVGMPRVFLSVKERPQKVKHWNNVVYGSKYARGMLYSEDVFTYGVYTLDCVLPKGKNLHSSFWLTNAKYWPPEIDIFEAYTNSIGSYTRFGVNPCFGGVPMLCSRHLLSYAVETNVHYKNDFGNHTQIGAYRCRLRDLHKPTSTPCNYKLRWAKDRITIWYDGVVVRDIHETDCPYMFEDLNAHPFMHVIISTGVFKDRPTKMKSDMVLNNFTYLEFSSENFL